MPLDTIVLLVGLAAAVYMAWNIGANDVANAMASPVGSKAITLKQAVIIAAILDIIGASLIGSHVAQTIRKDIVHPEILGGFFCHMVLSSGLHHSFYHRCYAGIWADCRWSISGQLVEDITNYCQLDHLTILQRHSGLLGI